MVAVLKTWLQFQLQMPMLMIYYKEFLNLTINEYFISFNKKMIKSRSYSSMVTRATSAERQQSPMLKFNNPKTQPVHILTNPFTSPYPLKFPKKLMHKQTSMNMLIQTEEVDRRPCLRADPNAHKASMMEVSTPRRQLKSGDFSHLAYESPSKPIRQRDFEDIGAISNRKRPNQNQNNSVCMLASINENIENVGPDKFVKIAQKKHFKQTVQVKKQLQWSDDKPNKQRFQMKYRKVGRQCLKQKNTTQSSYSSIHMKYTTFK